MCLSLPLTAVLVLQAKAQFEAAVQRFNTEQKEVEQLMQARDEAYLGLLAINESKTTLATATQHGDYASTGKLSQALLCCLRCCDLSSACKCDIFGAL